jgi:glutamate/aspartate transport system substrate-binding protein
MKFINALAAVFLLTTAEYSLADTLARIQSEKTIRIGLRENAKPFGYFEADKPGGLSWMLCSAIVGQMEVALNTKIKMVVTPVTLKTSFDGLEKGDIDLQCGSTPHTREREEKVDFSYNFFVSGLTAAYRKEDVIYANPLQFGRVAVLSGSTAQKIIESRAARKAIASILSVVPVKNYAEGLEALKKNEADTFFADMVLIPADPAISVRRSLETIEPYALMMRKDDQRFATEINKAMKVVLSSGKMKAFTNIPAFEGRVNYLTLEAWRNPSKTAAMSFY